MDFKSANSVQTPVKEELEMKDIKEEPIANSTTTAHVPTPVEEKLEIEDFKKDPDLAIAAAVENPIKEELDIEKLEEESKDVTSPTTSGQSKIKEEPGITSSTKKIPHENDTGHDDDASANKSDFKDDDKLQIDDQKASKSETEESGTAKKKNLTNVPSTSNSSSRERSRRLFGYRRALMRLRVSQLFENAIRNSRDFYIRDTLSDALEEFAKSYCQECKVSFASLESERCGTCDTILIYECVECLTTYNTLAQLHEHMISHHVRDTSANARYKCLFCRKGFENLEILKEHSRNCYDHEYNFCLYCSYDSKFKQDLIEHIKSCHKDLVSEPETEFHKIL